jgi:hypothetical protein
MRVFWRAARCEIGAGSGYAAAVLAEIASEVYAIQRIGQLAEKAAINLSSIVENSRACCAMSLAASLLKESSSGLNRTTFDVAQRPRNVISPPGYLLLPVISAKAASTMQSEGEVGSTI